MNNLQRKEVCFLLSSVGWEFWEYTAAGSGSAFAKGFGLLVYLFVLLWHNLLEGSTWRCKAHVPAQCSVPFSQCHWAIMVAHSDDLIKSSLLTKDFSCKYHWHEFEDKVSNSKHNYFWRKEINKPSYTRKAEWSVL